MASEPARGYTGATWQCSGFNTPLLGAPGHNPEVRTRARARRQGQSPNRPSLAAGGVVWGRLVGEAWAVAKQRAGSMALGTRRAGVHVCAEGASTCATRGPLPVDGKDPPRQTPRPPPLPPRSPSPAPPRTASRFSWPPPAQEKVREHSTPWAAGATCLGDGQAGRSGREPHPADPQIARSLACAPYCTRPVV